MHAQTCTCDEVLVVSDITCVCILINAFIYKVMLILENSLIYYCAALARLQDDRHLRGSCLRAVTEKNRIF